MSGKVMLIAVLLALLSCAGGGVQTVTEERDGWRVNRLQGVHVKFDRRTGGTYGQVSFSAEKRQIAFEEARPATSAGEGNRIRYALIVVALVQNGLGVREGDPLDLMFNGTDTLELFCSRATGQGRTMQMGNPTTGRAIYQLEELRYELPKDTLSRIAFANEVEFTIFGAEDTLRGSFTDANLEAFRRFYTDYVH